MASLQVATDGAGLPPMTDEQESRGAAIERRFNALGLSDRQWMHETGIDIKTLRRAMADKPSTREASYEAIESKLKTLEDALDGSPSAAKLGRGINEEGMVEFRLSGNFGVDVVVKGPVSDRAALEESVMRLLREMHRE